MFDDAALDVNFDSMADQRMAYPLAYGYSLVGRVTECGPEVQDGPSLLGKLVFVFAAHASQVIVDRSALHVVPPGINAMDAIFMPSVETALSIVHDAHVRLGEHVAVFGQGLIGLLVTALLGKHGMYATASKARATLTTFDNFPDRLALSSVMGSSQALFPSDVQSVELFDIAIEVSGHPKALQSAIDYTRNGGRIVIASWYGNRKLDLRLGIDFHRSHKLLQTSQVSEIPAELRTTWSKQRRFDLTWDLVREIQPSRRLLTRRAKLHEVQDVYEALDAGREIAVAFEY
jgi:threonine dehydrogenase-like Zn-dependent dehydrogenase